MVRSAAPDRAGRIHWIEQTLGGIAGAIERAVFTEEHTRQDGWLQVLDPRAKLGMFLAVVLAASLSRSLATLVPLYLLTLLVAWRSRLPFDFFVKRVWLGIPFFAGLVMIPSIFMVPGPPLLTIAVGPIHLAASGPGIFGAIVFVVRVGVCVSLAVLLVLTTPWADLLKSLQAFRVPPVFILILSMTYRYIFLFLHSANGMIEGRKSRLVGRASGGDERRWISQSVVSLMNRSFKMSNEVYAAMLARGFTGRIRTYSSGPMRRTDWAGLAGAIGIALATLAIPRLFG